MRGRIRSSQTPFETDVSYTITRTDVVWRNGEVNLVREPVEVVADGVEGFFRLPYDIDRAFRLGL